MKLIFIDSEATSLDRYKRRIWDLAYIVREPGKSDREVQFFFNVSLKHADPISLKIGGYYERHPAPYERYGSFKHALEQVAQDFRGATLVGAVPSFDEETLARFMWEKLGLQPTWHYHLIDIETLVAGRIGIAPPWNYDKVIAAAGLPPIAEKERHTALGDVRTVRDLFDWWAADCIGTRT